MTGRDFAKIWTLAFSLVAAAVIFLTTIQQRIDRRLLAGPVVAIGSSLMRNAIPATPPGPGGLLGDGRAHVRFDDNLISVDETVSLMSTAVDSGAATILVEVNAFAFDIAFATRRANDPWVIQASRALQNLANELRRDFKWQLGAQPLPPFDEPDVLEGAPRITSDALATSYPLRLHALRNPQALAETLDQARGKGTEIIFIAFPRSQSAADYIGEQAQASLMAHLEALADHLGAPLFWASPTWPDEYFLDPAHMNARGRARFLAELAAWWAEHAWRPKP